jgi:integrase
MPVYKRWKGKKINANDPHWDEARWTVEFRIQGKRVQQAVPTARTKAQALSAESKLREDAYSRRYGRGAKAIGFTDFFDNHYLPWSEDNKRSYRDDVSRGKKLKAYFKDDAICDIRTFEIEQFIQSMLGKKTTRNNPRSAATVNRYFSLLSKMFTRAKVEQFVDFNPCADMEKGKERSRERYITAEEQVRFMAALVGDVRFLIAPFEVAINAGLRKDELVSIKAEHVNLSGVPTFCEGLEILPNWLLVIDSKTGDPRQVPMNHIVRDVLREVVQGAKADDLIFTFQRNGVSWSTIRSGFENACDAANLPHGQKVSGGLVWHDLRRTFATRLRALGVHEYDIKTLLGHKIAGVTAGYARHTPQVLENAVELLAETKGKVVRFERKAS